ncbi:CPBP family intramembrane metalloprotease [Lentilactobacillus sp. TOM.63]|uniref:CPBP family intramembrane glutamic endopeptidase n=1 Tax=Lentilactobacillus sp. TOM.63 TaxID=3055077 RepID=UPI0025A0CB32|nr:CPBP family intramembrane glutamic endopeptidase [Lentilactobacillus sp. TOM.63]MDM7516974.1 CPBP family intramembrane metalloprotease [Lentilactobacillus sp. TOM.63]
MSKSRFSIFNQFASAIVLVAMYLGVDVIFHGTSPLIHASFRFVFALIVAGIVYYIIGADKLRNSHVKYRKSTKVWCFLLVLAALLVFRNVTGQIIQVLGSKTLIGDTFMALSAGICEEFLFRGLLLSSCLCVFNRHRLRYTLAACSSSALFGLFHFVNALHQPLNTTVQQVIYAFVLGLLLASIRIATNTMGWNVLLHSLFDWSAGLSVNPSLSGITPWTPFIIIWGLVFLVALFFLISFDHNTNDSHLSKTYSLGN